ncbi:uncharacterized protein AMSG_06957 [Thecamonas trahens ATCC 50062]|uniref:Uncharacterized protein n=1 Tax=Thecamonas trahens ATCC 50062 TaxID=461836 RepID=A0A0L0DF64_THETB|nr:hypothetical protein AMSG_06957 [Thecamonas trahens ATCC 50062]KNC50987.1 hypothetical protein AMSG_06957 [Thecamonas trahens ATCC 50062]|eukprot:XP_013756457.1 hypothetical protein AMSG_06957 [Thecamonas trahens ATCC 50062]
MTFWTAERLQFLRVAQWAVPVMVLAGVPLYNRYLGGPEKRAAWEEYKERQRVFAEEAQKRIASGEGKSEGE